MKKILFLALLIGFTLSSFGQAPNYFNYQAVLRDANGVIIQNQNVSLKISIHERLSVGIMVYEEQHAVNTNGAGLVNLHIGNGTNKMGSINAIDWGKDVYVIKIQLDPTGGSNFKVMGFAQLVSVPYALYAANVNNSDTSASNEIQVMSLSTDTLFLSNGGGFVKLPTGGSGGINNDNDSTNELQTITLNANNITLSNSGGVVSLASYLDNTDAQIISLTNDTLYLSNGGKVFLGAYNTPNTDSQTLSISGATLSIAGGNSVTLSTGSGGPNNDNDSTNELISSFSLSTNNLQIVDAGGSKTVSLASYLDNTDSQTLSITGNTISITGGNSITLPSGSGPNNDNDSTNEIQLLSISGSILSLSKGNSITLPAGGGPNNDNDSTNEFQNLSISGSTLTISDGNSITLPGGGPNNDNDSTNELNSAVSLSGTTLSVTDAGGAKTANLSSFMDNTDSQRLSLNGDTLSLSGGNSVKLGSGSVNLDNDSTNEVQNLSITGSTLTISKGNSITLPAFGTSNDNDSTNELNTAFALTGTTLTLTDAGGAKTANLSSLNTDSQSLTLTGNTLAISGGNSVTLPAGSTSNDNDSTNEIQNLSIAGNVLTISKGNNVTLPSTTTKGIDSVLTAGNNAAGLALTNLGSLGVNNGITASTIQLSTGAGVNKILTSDASGNGTWQTPASITLGDTTQIADLDGDTKIQTEESSDEDRIRFDLAGSEKWVMQGARLESMNSGRSVFVGEGAGQNDDLTANYNGFIGYRAGFSNTSGAGGVAIGYEAMLLNSSGLGNSAIGYQALRSNSTSRYNVAIGFNALRNSIAWGNTGIGAFALDANTSGSYNTSLGYASLTDNVSGIRNIAIGNYALGDNVTGHYNSVVGDEAFRKNITGRDNTIMGRRAGYNTLTGSRNIFLGYNAGYNENGSDRLYIDNSSSATPLIYGNFSSDSLRLNSAVSIRDEFYLPNGAGNNLVLTSDASGRATWKATASIALGDTTQISDLDGDTKIRTEKSSDEDIIRFDLAGTEQWVMKGARLENNNSGLSTFIGQGAGEKDDLSNNRNSFVGYYAGQNTVTGVYNSAFGDEALRNNTSNYNTAVGSNALNRNISGQQNTATGYYSLRNNVTGNYNSAYGVNVLRSNSTGNYNTASGYYSMASSVTGSSNTATGSFSLRLNSTGYGNSAHGYAALYFNSTGYQNTSSGPYSLYRNTTGYLNTAMGYGALQNVTTGYHNSGVGVSAGVTMQTGYQNSILGYQAMYYTTTGNNNAALGYRAGFYNQAGYQNTYVGSNAGPTANSGYFNSMALGYNTSVGASNQVRVGNSSVTSIGGQVGWTTVSDGRYKENVQSNVAGLSFIMELKPVTYNLNAEALRNKLENKDSVFVSDFEKESMINKFNFIQSGFVAQDVEKAAKKVGYSFSGVDAPKNDNDIYGLRYSEFVVPLVKATQEQQELINKQQKQIKNQDVLIQELMKRLKALETAK